MTRRRIVWLALTVLVLGLALVTAAALLNLPALVRSVALWQLRAQTGRAVTLEALDLSLAEGRLGLRGLRVVDHDGGPLAEVGRLEGRFDPWSLLRGSVWFHDLALTDVHMRIVRTEANRLNIADLLERPASSRGTLDTAIDRFTLAGGRVTFEDRTLTPAHTWRADVRLDARQLTTRGRQGTAVGSVAVAGAFATIRVDDWQLAPAHLRAVVNVRDLDIRLARIYIPANSTVRLHRGGLSAGLTIVVDAAEGTRLDADAVVEDLALRRPGMAGDALAAPRLEILVRELHRRTDTLALRYASVGGDVTVLDPTQTPPRPLTFSDLTLTAGSIEQAQATAQIALHANVPGGGEVDVTGTAGAVPLRADARVRARGLELTTLARYLPIEAQLAGTATADVRVVATHDRALALTVAGDATLDRVSLGDGGRTLAGASRVRASALEYRWPATVAVGQLTVSQPSVTVARAADGTLDLATLMRPRPDPAEAAAAGATSLSPEVRIAALKVEDGRAVVTDAGTSSRVEVTRLVASARDLAWPGRGAAPVELSATVAGAAVTAKGTVDVQARQADLDLGLRGGDLALLQPWLPIPGRVRGALGRADLRVSARQAEAEPLALTVTGTATLERLAVTDGSRQVAGAGSVTVGGLDYTWPATVRIADLTIGQPSVRVERDAAGALNLAALARPVGIAPADASAPDASRPAVDVAIARVRLQDGRAHLADAGSGGSTEITGIDVTGEDVSWPARGTSSVRLAAAVGGGRLTARGTVDGAQKHGEIAVTLRGADLAALQSWLPIVGRVRGAAEADVTVTLGLEPFSLALQGTAGVANLAFHDSTRPLLTVGRVDATGLDLQWPTRLAIDRLRVNTPWAQIDRTPEGELSLRALFRRRPDRPSPPPPTAGPEAAGLVAGMELSVREAHFDNGGVNIVDDAVEPAARFEIRGSRLSLHNLTWPDQGPAQLQFSTPMPGSGVLKASGTFSIEPTRVQLDVALDTIDLAPGRPYLPIDARVSGRVTGRAKVTGDFGDTITLVVDADAAVDRLALGDADRRLATAQRVELTGVRYQYPMTIRVRQVVLRKPWALVERNAGGELELLTLLTRRRPAVPAAPAAGAAPAPRVVPTSEPAAAPPARVRVAIDRLTMDEGFLRFVDRSTDPDFAEELGGITLTAEALGTNPRRHGTIDLRGTLASGTPLSVAGQISSFTGPLFLDLTVGVKGYPMPRLNSYLDRLSSWIARQGVLSAALRYKLDGDDLDATNEVWIDGLELDQGGRGGDFQRRIGLPLGTLVPLLKNTQGQIHLTIPVRGQLSSPDFHYSDAVWTAMRGLAIRLVSLPFSWIGRLNYTEDARIESIQVYPVPFQTAKATLTSFGGDHIQRLMTFLKEQPAIRLRLRPVTTVADVTALRREALDARLASAGADPAARRQAAVALYTELFPRRQPPASDEALLDELTRETPTPPRALRALATDRTAAIRDGLVRGGVAADRLEPAEARAAVEAEGEPRVEFEIIR